MLKDEIINLLSTGKRETEFVENDELNETLMSLVCGGCKNALSEYESLEEAVIHGGDQYMDQLSTDIVYKLKKGYPISEKSIELLHSHFIFTADELEFLKNWNSSL